MWSVCGRDRRPEDLDVPDRIDHKTFGRDTISTMRLIAGAGGDGATKRRQWVMDEYGDDTLYDEAQKKINWYLE